MNLEKINPVLKQQIVEFTETLKRTCGTNLRSIVLYGGVAKLDYNIGKSNVNMLFIFETVDLNTLDSITLLFQKAISEFRLTPFILTESEVQPSSDVFAIKLFDIKQHHVLIAGEDFLKDLEFNESHLKFLAEQELRNQLARMKFFYIQNFNLSEVLYRRIQTGFTSLIINANIFLYLKQKTYYPTRAEIIDHLLKEPEMDSAALKKLLSVKESSIVPNSETIKLAYDQLMIQYKQLIKVYKKIDVNG